MGIFKINFSDDVSVSQDISAIPLKEISEIQPSAEDPEGESILKFHDHHGGRGKPGRYSVHVKMDFNTLCQEFADCAERKTVVDLTGITQAGAFSKKTPPSRR